MLERYEEMVERIPKDIQYLRENRNLYLYGNGSYAESMYQFCKKYGIHVKGVLVSKEYRADLEFHNIDIIEAEAFLEQIHEKISVIAGFKILYHQLLISRLANCSYVDKIYVLDGCSVLWNNDFKFPEPPIYLLDNYFEGLIKKDLSSEYFNENICLFTQTYDWLEDALSKRTMDDYLRGHIELLNFPMRELFEEKPGLVQNQYFDEEIISLTDREVFIDCGAYTGDTLESFASRVEKFSKYYALEPDERCFDRLCNVIRGVERRGKVIHIPMGSWKEKTELRFSIENACGEIAMDEGAKAISVDKIDNIIGLNEEKITFIKMDVEGSELFSLQGAEEVIKRDKPKLAICVYHKREDLITLPQYIKKLVPEYKLYLRCYFPYASELVLYAVCE